MTKYVWTLCRSSTDLQKNCMQGLATSKVLFSGDNALVKQKLQKAIAILSGSVFPRLNKFFFLKKLAGVLLSVRRNNAVITDMEFFRI
jgi:hypothetical protein